LTKTSRQGAEVPLYLAMSNSDEVIGAENNGGYFGGAVYMLNSIYPEHELKQTPLVSTLETEI
jgi:hypothetical protein